MFRLTTIAALAITFAAPASAVTMAAYDTVNGQSIAASIESPYITAADLTRGAGLREVGNANHFRSRRWRNGGSAATALSGNRYLEWGFTSSANFTLDTLSLRYDRNANGPTSIAIFASFDGGAFSQIFTDTTVTTTVETTNIDLSAYSVDTATFRLVGWNATNNSGRFWLTNNGVGPGNAYGLALTGDITPVPVPASLPLLVGAIGLFGVIRRKRPA
jgi:hypothetical protein